MRRDYDRISTRLDAERPSGVPTRSVGTRVLRSVVVVTFVVWHLTVLTLRNTVEMFSLATTHRRPAYEALDRAIRYYETRLALYQTWPMFTSPLSRSGPFLTTRLDFDDGSSFDIRSDNEPADLNSFFRIGLARQRKHEDYLANTRPEERWRYERPLWEQFVRWKIDRWRRARRG